MSKNSAQQRVEQVQEWYKWFNKKYNKTITEKDWDWYMKDNEQE